MKVIEGSLSHPRSQLQEAYDLFRLEKQGALLSPATRTSTTCTWAPSFAGSRPKRLMSRVSTTSMPTS